MNKRIFSFWSLTFIIIILLPLLYACNIGDSGSVSSDDESSVDISATTTAADIQTTVEPAKESVQTTEETTDYGTVLSEGDSDHEHVVSEQIIVPTCTSVGYTLKVCECGFSAKSDITDLIEHVFAQKDFPPTCTEHGGVIEYCTECEYSEIIEYSVEPFGHELTVEITAATCEEPETTHSKCSVCDYDVTEITAEALGHNYIAPESIDTLPSARQPEISYTSTCICGDAIQTELAYSDIFGGAYVESTEVLAKGLDISMWQFAQKANGDYINLNWQAIKDSGIDYVILKIGSGNHAPDYFKDPTFEMSYAGAKAAGLDVGCYFYSYATSVKAISDEADFLLTLLDGKQFEYPVYLDFEDPSQESLTNEIRTEMAIEFLSKLQSNGYYGALYAGQYWLHNYFDTARINSLFDVWMAKYKYATQEWNDDEWNQSYTYIESGAYGMWQFTSTATVIGNGVSVKDVGIASPSVDKNYCYKDYPTLIKTLGYNGFEKTSSETDENRGEVNEIIKTE